MTSPRPAPRPTALPDLVVPHRYCGPPVSGNGGWTAGALASLLADATTDPVGPVTVTLRTPPPLDVPMAVTLVEEADGPVVTATAGGGPVATAGPGPEPRAVPAVGWEEAAAAEEHYPGLRHHPFATCFVCGTEREPGDGLRIFPGPVGDRDAEAEPRVAATWVPHPSVAGAGGAGPVTTAVAWAALDCISGWAGDLEERWMVLGRMTAVVDRLPVVGERLVVVGAHRGTEGRKTSTAATLHDADGTVLARAEHTWVAVDPAAFS